MRIGIISDIHCDLQALETALEALRDVDQVICVGDLNLQYRFSNEISEIMQELYVPVVRGNHDAAILSSSGVMLRASGQIKPDNLTHLRRVPLMLEWNIDGKKVMMMHTSPLDPTGGQDGGRAGVLLPWEGDRLAQPMFVEGGENGGTISSVGDNAAAGHLEKIPNDQLPEAKADVLVVGHTHRPLITHVGKTLLINPGSLGQPRDPKKSTMRTYAILDTSKDWEATIHGFEQPFNDAPIDMRLDESE